MRKLIYTNERAIAQAKAQGRTQLTNLNLFITDVEQECKTTFTDEEKLQLKTNAERFLREWIKPHFLFPKATAEFNIQALGLDLDSLVQQFNKNSTEWNKYPYELINGKFELDTERIEELNKVYASNEFQNDALELAQELIKLIDKGIDKGVLKPDDTIRISEVFSRILKLEPGYNTDQYHDLIPNPAIPYQYKYDEGLKRYR